MTTGQQLACQPTSAIDAAWRDHANCRTADLQLFFPAGESRVAEIMAAKAVCQACQVRNACLGFALETRQEDGIWGGTTEAERRRLRRTWRADRRRQTQVTA